MHFSAAAAAALSCPLTVLLLHVIGADRDRVSTTFDSHSPPRSGADVNLPGKKNLLENSRINFTPFSTPEDKEREFPLCRN